MAARTKGLNPFWAGVADTPLPMWLIQVDLQGHSRWVESIASWPDALAARLDFVKQLTEGLRPFQFLKSHWAGDGGLFVAPVVTSGSVKAVKADSVVEAANACSEVFRNWRAGSDDRSQVGIRISLHQASIWTDDEPGNWFSDELNRFMKFERDLAMVGTVSMTEIVFRSLHGKNQQGWFPTKVMVGDAAPWTVYWNTQQKLELNETTFVKWLSNSRYAVASTLTEPLRTVGDTITFCGNCLIIAAPVSSAGFENRIELEELSVAKWVDDVPALARSEHGHDYAKVSPIEITQPLTDSPKMKIRYVRGWYKWAREFGRSIYNDPRKRLHYSSAALSLDRSKGAIPDILCSHILVVLDDKETKTPWLLICQRADLRSQVDFMPGSWTVSVEEQYRPAVNINTKGHAEEHDKSIHESVVRGIREELGIPDDILPAVETHALFVEGEELRTAILAVARVMLEFEKFKLGFKQAVDSGELKAAVVVPLNKENVELLLSSDTVPVEFLNQQGKWIKGKIDDGSHRSWHGSSKLRLVLARWLLEPRRN
jgi:hypothetical protein